MKVLCRVPSVIERDALMAALLEKNVSAFTPERNVMVNLAGEPNLSLEGASITFPGYDIRVPEDQYEEARNVLAEFRRRHDVRIAPEGIEEPAHDGVDEAGRRFLKCSFWGIVMPLVMNVPAMYWFFRSRNVIQKRFLLTVFALALNVCEVSLGIFFLIGAFGS